MNGIAPRSAYADRLAARKAAVAALADRLGRLSAARLAVFLAGLLLAALALGFDLFHGLFLLVPAAGFFALVARYELTRGGHVAAGRAVRYYERGLARLDGKALDGDGGARFADDGHPYSADLDLFGPGSLYERMSAARTRVGEETLAAWLRAPADAAEVAARQAAVADLVPRLDLREALAGGGADAAGGIDYAALAAWGAAPAEPVAAWKFWAVEALGWANVFGLLGWLFVGTGPLPLLASGLLSLFLGGSLRGRSRRVLAPVESAERDLSLLESLLGRLEREAFDAPRLRELQAAMRAEGRPASAQVRDLRNLVAWLDVRHNALTIPIVLLRMWDVRYAFFADAWRRRSGPRVGAWLRAIGDAEALSSLAGYAFENPGDVFPAVGDGPARFEGEGVGHPLLPADRCVRNDVRLGGEGGPRLLVVSGSNMSGKSTLLRAVGANAALALAGGVVRATRLSLAPAALGATMRVEDSIRAGRSRFFAEVTRVRALLDAAELARPPLLFLLDELFSGTNSQDRVAGAEAVLRAFLDAGAIGLATTHDLALTAVTDRLGDGAVNVHFTDGFADGRLQFDYAMRPGVVPHGNGLALMRAVGLDV